MHSKVKPGPWRGQPLPRGRHKLPSAAVRASQRDRLERAVLELVAEHGFDGTTVPMVVKTARVSSNAFYEFFADKTECFLSACDGVGRDLLGELVLMASEPDWIRAMRRGTDTYLRWWQARPAFARAYLLSLPSAGGRALEQRERTYELFRAMFEDLGRRARVEQPDLPPLSPIVPRVLVVAITEVVAEEVRADRVASLAELGPEISTLGIRLLADDATATRA